MKRFQLSVRAAFLILPLVVFSLAAPAEWTPTDAPNQPMGEGKGIAPGRVVWAYDANVAKWDGRMPDPKARKPASGPAETFTHWGDDTNTNAAIAARMLSDSLRSLTNAKTDNDAWAALFTHYNKTHGRGEASYKPGEKIVIKLNLNTAASYKNQGYGYYNTPQATLALLRQLVAAGVKQADIVLYDASRYMPDAIFKPAHAEFPDIRFEDREGGEGRFKCEPDMKSALHFGDPNTEDNDKTFLPTCVTGATYMINAGVMKGHDLAGVTLCAKNHFGSTFRESATKSWNKGWDPGNMHASVCVHDVPGMKMTARPMGSYNALVDLTGHKDLGGKTILYLIDAIYASPRQGGDPAKWQSAPFNGGWTCSLFVSQDPIAIESVCLDFFRQEPTISNISGNVDNFLHEAAAAGAPPSKTNYAPSGQKLTSLGAHEHWNNAKDRQYSRNLGKTEGIELITVK